MPSDLLSHEAINQNRIKLYIEDLPLRNFGDRREIYLKSIPPRMLVSLKLRSPTPPLSTRLQSLKELLVQAARLETFHYQDQGQGTQFSLTGTERLPALKELRLKCYDWNHDREQVQAHWDFSQIRSLELISMPIQPFLDSVSFPDFAGLHTLHVEDFSAHLPDRREEATDALYTLIRYHIRALRVLDITVHTPLFPVDGFLAYADTLEVLRFRDHTGFAEEDRHCPTLKIKDLASISEALVHVHTLELDMDIRLIPTQKFLGAVSNFPSLHTLTLHTQTLIRPNEVMEDGSDRDWAFALRVFRFLLQARKANHFSVGARPPWKNITVNVGGWNRVMVRRLSEAWKAQNRRGVFAERCFLLERTPDGTYWPKEESTVEPEVRDDWVACRW